MPLEDGRLAAAGSGFIHIGPNGQVTELAQPESGNVAVRMNDGKCDPHGRFWAGSMSSARRESCALYRMDTNRSVHKIVNRVGISNGLGWSPDERFVYYVDTTRGTLDVFDFDADDGVPANPARWSASPRRPRRRRHGEIWPAFWNGGAIHRYTPDGTLDTTISVPVDRPTSCCLVGTDSDTLFITSAAPEPAHLNPSPGASSPAPPA